MITSEIQPFIQPIVAEAGCILWGVEYIPQGKHSLLRVYIDKEGGVAINDCERVSRQLSAILDVEDLIKTHYSLEVSSPGIPRPLFSKEHYQRYQGQEVQVKTYKTVNGCRRFIGIIQSVTEDAVTLNVQGDALELQFSQIVKANLGERGHNE